MSSGVSGKYRLERRLGGGGMADVFAGSTVGAEGFERKVAIKRVRPGYSENERFGKMFVAEAKISSLLVHPNIVSVLDFDRDADGQLFLVMELIDGVDLDDLIATGLLPFDVVIFVIAEVLRGLGFAHDLPSDSNVPGVIHRDVSPHNVLLSWEGAVKISDFGIAKARAATAGATASVFIKGKPSYMSPEQANGQRLDGRSDLFAVGVVLWEMLVGQRLFVGDDNRATLAAVLFGRIPRPRALRPEVPRDLDRVAMKLLERDLPARYATAEVAIADLMSCSDAPRAGREALSAVLAERFPDEVPVRHSVARARARDAAPPPAAGAIPLYSRPTLTGVPEGPAAFPMPSRPGMDTMDSPDTGALVPPTRRWLTVVVIALALLIASAVISFIVVSFVRQPAAPDAPARRSNTGAADTPQPRANAVQSIAPASLSGSPRSDLSSRSAGDVSFTRYARRR
jgi:serine/threonine-protein kinase